MIRGSMSSRNVVPIFLAFWYYSLLSTTGFCLLYVRHDEHKTNKNFILEIYLYLLSKWLVVMALLVMVKDVIVKMLYHSRRCVRHLRITTFYYAVLLHAHGKTMDISISILYHATTKGISVSWNRAVILHSFFVRMRWVFLILNTIGVLCLVW